MYAAERQALILQSARAVGRVEVIALAADLDVTPETVRRDLTALERPGVLRRVHGGAMAAGRVHVAFLGPEHRPGRGDRRGRTGFVPPH